MEEMIDNFRFWTNGGIVYCLTYTINFFRLLVFTDIFSIFIYYYALIKNVTDIFIYNYFKITFKVDLNIFKLLILVVRKMLIKLPIYNPLKLKCLQKNKRFFWSVLIHFFE